MTQQTQVFGHRGASDAATGVTENTVAAYLLARDLGADGVELDVRLGADDSLLLHHDPCASDGRAVAEMSLADRPAWMPTLAEALDVLDGSIVNIEIKNSPTEDAFDPDCRVADLVVDLLSERQWRDRVVISSFHLGTIDRVKRLAPGIRTGVLSLLTMTAPESIVRATDGGHDAIHPFVAFVTADLVAEAHDAGLDVNVWTVNHPEAIRDMVDLGVDGICTDDVPAVVEQLRSGQA